jgi:hypothetical protein
MFLATARRESFQNHRLPSVPGSTILDGFARTPLPLVERFRDIPNRRHACATFCSWAACRTAGLIEHELALTEKYVASDIAAAQDQLASTKLRAELSAIDTALELEFASAVLNRDERDSRFPMTIRGKAVECLPERS